MIGIVKWFNADKGFGFITKPDGESVIVFYPDIIMKGYKLLYEDQKVEFNIIQSKTGPKAVNVRVIKEGGI
jgi:CspA family cold shock protein